MRALPGRSSRNALSDAPAAVTRKTTFADQRRRVLQAAGELVAKRGYGNVTVELIVKRARVSYKTFYRHFRGKEECFLAFYDDYMASAQEQIEAALAAHAASAWPEQVIVALRALFQLICADPLLARAAIVEAPTVGAVIIDRYVAATRGLSPLLRRGREFSDRRDELPQTLEDTLAGGVLWSAYQRIVASEVDQIEPLLPEAVEFVLRPYLGAEQAAEWAQAAPRSADDSLSPTG